MPYIEHLYYEEAGSGPPLLLIHCPAVSHVYWRPLMNRLQDRFRCIAPDLRGHGRSGLGDRPWRYADIARDIAMLTGRLQLEPPVLVGYSSGASIAFEAALHSPEQYAGIVAVSAFPMAQGYLRWKARVGLWATQLGLVRFIGPNVLSSNSADRDHLQAMLPDARQVNPGALRSYFQESIQYNCTLRLGEIRTPVLLVYGTKDQRMLGYGRMLMRRLPNVDVAFVTGADHRVPTRQPDRFASLVAEFAQRVQPEPPAWPAQAELDGPAWMARIELDAELDVGQRSPGE